MNLDSHLDHLLDLAKSAWKEDRFAVAAELLAPYLRHRDEAYPWFVYGDSLRVIGLCAEAERALQHSHELAPDKPWPILRLAWLRKDSGDHDGAERYFNMVAEDREIREMGWYWIARGANLAELNQLKEAELCYRCALALSNGTDHDEAWLNIGMVLRAAGKYAGAINAFRKAVELTPNYPEALEAIDGLKGIDEAVKLARATPPPES